MYRLLATICVFAVLFTNLSTSSAEDINKIFAKVNELVAAGNYSKAMKELTWANKELEKLHFKKIESLLPNELAGFTGQEPSSESAMGITAVEREYTKGTQSVQLTISGGTLGGAAGAGGFAALGQMAALMGNQPGTDTFRIDGLTVRSEVRNNYAELTAFLESGSILKLEQRNANSADTLKSMAEGIGLGKLDAYLAGK